MTTTIQSDFLEKITQHIKHQTFVKITLSKYCGVEPDLKNIYARLVTIKGKLHLSFTYRYATKDIVKNYLVQEGIERIGQHLPSDFLMADLFTTENDFSLTFDKKNIPNIVTKKASQTTATSTQHDKQKKRNIEPSEQKMYLQALGITSQSGEVLQEGQKKFRQINKYIEIIDTLIDDQFPNDAHIVDMGSGKGYLTFALYDFLRNKKKSQATLKGIELRLGLVDFCNELAKKSNFEGLSFLASDINDYQPTRIDMLIALHACDIATDIALAKGIAAGASLIVVAPCCHKQLRKAMNTTSAMQSILRHGILEERQAELLTDGIRALLLEAHGYSTKVFEFISTEHTPKNVLIVGTKSKANPEALQKIEAIKAQFGIKTHYLETLLTKK
jgi:Methyltransferase domain